MTATDPFTTPAEADREARLQQARDRLNAATAHISVYASNATSLNYVDAARAIRDAMVGQGHALLAVREELADVAASLRTLAAAPSAVQNVAFQVANLQETLDNGLAELVEGVRDHVGAVNNGTAAAVDTGDGLTDAVRELADVISRPRWWQWRRRGFNRKAAIERLRTAREQLHALDDDAEDEEYLRLNRAVLDAEQHVPWWRR
jgi:hypothetical protein